MTPQLYSTMTATALHVVLLIAVSVLTWFGAWLIREGISHIRDTRLRNAAASLVALAEKTITTGGGAKLTFVADALAKQFPRIPSSMIEAVIEQAVALLPHYLDWTTGVSSVGSVASDPLPVLDKAALDDALNKGLAGLVPTALVPQIADIIDGAFNQAITTVEKAVSPVQVADQKAAPAAGSSMVEYATPTDNASAPKLPLVGTVITPPTVVGTPVPAETAEHVTQPETLS